MTFLSFICRQVIALAKHRGIKTINVVRRSDAAKELKDLGWVAAADIQGERDLWEGIET